MKKGFTLLEVIISIAVASILFSGILLILNLTNRYQSKKEESWKAYKILENIHSMYLNDPSFLENDSILYFDRSLNKVNSIDHFKVEYTLTLTIIDNTYITYSLKIDRIFTDKYDLIINYDLGKWVKP